MNRLIALIKLFFLPASLWSQTSIDNALFIATYHLTSITDTVTGKKNVDEPMILLAGNKASKFYSHYKNIGDSLLKQQFQNHSFNSIAEGGQMISNPKYYQSKPSMIVYQNYPEGKITYRESLNLPYQYQEALPAQTWELTGETDSVLGYPCQKATTVYGGRNYEAWFTTLIPLPFGPWKLGGLPGLILKAWDTKRNFVFECVSIHPFTKPIVLDQHIFSLSYSTLPKKDFLKTKQLYKTQFALYMQQQGAQIKSIRRADGTEEDVNEFINRKKPYNPMERLED